MKAKKLPDWKLLGKLAAAYCTTEDTEDARYYLCCVAYFMGPKGLDIVATDGHTLFQGHVDDMKAPQPMGGSCSLDDAEAGKDPDMQPGGVVGFPKWERITVPAAKEATSRRAVEVPVLGWKDFAAAAKLWRKLNSDRSFVAMQLTAGEEGWALLGSYPEFGSMKHLLLWPKGRYEPKNSEWFQAQYAERLGETASKLGLGLRFAPTEDDSHPHAAHAAWDGGSVTIAVMPCRL